MPTFLGHPVEGGAGVITWPFGAWDNSIRSGQRYQHRGVDYGVVTGTNVYTPAAGVVVSFTNDGSFGTGVCIQHEDGFFTLYAHLSMALVHVGEQVYARTLIGYSGNTGMSTGPHLHWQLCTSNSFPTDISYSRNPLDYLEEEVPDPRIDKLLAALGGEAAVDSWNSRGNSLLMGYELLQNRVGVVETMRDQVYGLNDLLHSWRGVLASQNISVP